MKKKNLAVGALIFLAAYLVFLGLIVGARAMMKPAETAPEAPETAASTVCTGTGSGFGGEVKATLTIAPDGTITDVVLEGESETPAIGGEALATLREQILSSQSAAIDGVSGASLTSGGIKEAVANALAQGQSSGSTGGTFTGTGSGFGGEVKATLTIGSDGTITDVVLEGESETPGIGGEALATLREQVLAAQSAEIDGVSGASLTSGGIKEAVVNALAQANGTN